MSSSPTPTALSYVLFLLTVSNPPPFYTHHSHHPSAPQSATRPLPDVAAACEGLSPHEASRVAAGATDRSVELIDRTLLLLFFFFFDTDFLRQTKIGIYNLLTRLVVHQKNKNENK